MTFDQGYNVRPCTAILNKYIYINCKELHYKVIISDHYLVWNIMPAQCPPLLLKCFFDCSKYIFVILATLTPYLFVRPTWHTFFRIFIQCMDSMCKISKFVKWLYKLFFKIMKQRYLAGKLSTRWCWTSV